MSMGTRRQRQRQEPLWITHTDLARAPGHPFYKRLNQLLDEGKFDEFAEKECAKFYAENNGRPSLTPGIYFRLLLVGYFEGIDSERGIAWRAADSLGLRQFLGIGWDERTPDHSTISRTRRLIDLETHRKVFFWVLGRLQDRGLVKGKTVGIDATTLEANAAMRSIVRHRSPPSCPSPIPGPATVLTPRRTLCGASPSRSVGGSGRWSSGPAFARPIRFPKTAAGPASRLPARRSRAPNRCLQNSPPATTGNRCRVSATDVRCSRHRTWRIPSRQTHRTSPRPEADSVACKRDGPGP